MDSSNMVPADDFIVPTGTTWSISNASVLGALDDTDLSRPQPTSFNVTTYSDSSGTPGSVVTSQLGDVASNEPASPLAYFWQREYDITMAPVSLTAGHYWITFQSNGVGPHWYWEVAWDGQHAIISNQPAMENCHGGWRPLLADQAFRLFGKSSITDTTPPVIVPTVSGTTGKNGWYTSSTTVSWNVTDPESGIASSTGCGATTLTSDTAGVTLTCSATNGAGLSSSQSVTIKIDQTPPSCSVSMTPTAIWPPNHKMVPVVASVTVNDDLSGPAGFRLTGLSTNEGSSANEIAGFVVGAQSTNGQLLADRNGTGSGRVYTFTYQAQDQAGNTSSPCAGTVTVPHNRD
jgi:hypothetical protein